MADSGIVPCSMKALLKEKAGESYSLVTVPVPEPRVDEVLIRVDLVSICGSDIALYSWNDVAKVIATIPFTPGHECTGVVVKRGEHVKIPIGQRIAVENHFFCGVCYQCMHDRGDICQNMGQFGHGRKTPHGGCSQYTLVPARYCYALTTAIPPDEAVLLEPLGVAHNAIEQLDVLDEDVLVLGCGPVGLFTVNLAKCLGAKRVIGADIDDGRLLLAKTMGADETINTHRVDISETVMKLTDNTGMGRICECSGAPAMVNASFSLLRKGGQIVMVGLPKQPLHIENVLQDIVFKSLTLKTIHGRRIFHTWKECERLVSEGKLNVKAVVSHMLPMSRFEEAYKVLFSGKGCKILMDPWK